MAAFDLIQPHLATETPIPDNLPENEKKNYLKKTEEKTKMFAEAKSLFENQAAQDLTALGFRVIRTPGRIDIHPSGERSISIINFFNMVSYTDPQDNRIIIALGCPEGAFGDKLKASFRTMLTNGGVQYNEIVFLDYEDSKKTLSTHGGISCRAKPIGIN